MGPCLVFCKECGEHREVDGLGQEWELEPDHSPGLTLPFKQLRDPGHVICHLHYITEKIMFILQKKVRIKLVKMESLIKVRHSKVAIIEKRFIS